MAQTPNLLLDKPTVGGDVNAWGALLNANFDKLDAIFDGGKTITASAVGVVPLTLKGAAGQTADLLKLQDNSGNDLFAVQPDADTTIRNWADQVLILNLSSGSAAAQNLDLRFSDRGTLVWNFRKSLTNSFEITEQGVTVRIGLGSAGNSLYNSGSLTADHIFRDSASAKRITIHGDADKISFGSAADIGIRRTGVASLQVENAAGSLLDLAVRSLGLGTGSPQISGVIRFPEISTPSNPPANLGYIYMKDNGSGKTQLVALFPTGVEQVIATEP